MDEQIPLWSDDDIHARAKDIRDRSGIHVTSAYWLAAKEMRDEYETKLAQRQLVYSHRNGETEPPTILGQYWFKDQAICTNYASDTAVLVTVEPHHYNAGYEHWMVSYDEDLHLLSEHIGQWWGPVTPPQGATSPIT